MSPRSFIRPVLVTETSPLLGDDCALCKEAFLEEDKLVICPQGGSRHHLDCWEANGNHCTAYGCEGYGEILTERRKSVVRPSSVGNGTESTSQPGRFSKVRTMPSSSMGCAQSCLVLSIALAIVLIAAGCFGLWAVADYLLMEVLDWQYRDPFSGSISLSVFVTSLGVLKSYLLL